MLICDIKPAMTDTTQKNRIREHRLAQSPKMSQARLAELVDMQQSAIGRLEKGDYRLTVDQLDAFAKALNVRPVDLLPRDLLAEDGEPYDDGATSKTATTPYEKPSDTAPHGQNSRDLVDILTDLTPNGFALILNNDDLGGEGYRKGDIVIVDPGRSARKGDIVCLQKYDKRGGAQTLLATYHPPFFLMAPLNHRPMPPIFNDASQVDIRGVVCHSLRKN